MDKLLVSIITPSFNSASTIRDTLQSVVGQTYPNIEHIVVDNLSSDKTLEIVREFSRVILVSERDGGVYSAYNKGWKLAKGEIIAFLNADDFYADSRVVEKMVEMLEKKSAGASWADLDYVDRSNPEKIIRHWRSSDYKMGGFFRGWAPAHPTFFARRELYEKFGGFDERFKIAADYELMLRFLEVNKVVGVYLPETTVKMRVGGMSNKSIHNVLRANWEVCLAFKKNNLRGGWLVAILKPISKLKQFLK